MIVAHHLGEELLPGLLATAAVTVPVAIAVVRARARRLGKRLRFGAQRRG